MTYYLYHYFEKEMGPFKNLSKLSMDEAMMEPRGRKDT